MLYLFQATGGDKVQIVKDYVGNYLAGWSVIPVCDPEHEEFLGCHMTGNVMCFHSGEEDIKSQDLLLTQVAVTSHRNLDLIWAHGTVAGETLFIS